LSLSAAKTLGTEIPTSVFLRYQLVFAEKLSNTLATICFSPLFQIFAFLMLLFDGSANASAMKNRWRVMCHRSRQITTIIIITLL
jgi:hypothetical protein